MIILLFPFLTISIRPFGGFNKDITSFILSTPIFKYSNKTITDNTLYKLCFPISLVWYVISFNIKVVPFISIS